MTAPYYSDDFVTLYQGRCEDILPTLSLSGSVHLITDPPYFKVKADEWDNQWKKSSEFLQWMGEWLRLAKPLLSPDASVWVFASPELTSAVESVVAAEFRVLNSVRWVKEQGWHKKANIDAARSFLSPWEGIVFAEQFADAYGDAAQALHREVFAPMGRYLQTEIERSGVQVRELQKLFPSATGNLTGAVSNWMLGYNMPSKDQYLAMRDLLNGDGGEYLRREYEELRLEYEELRRPFGLNDRHGASDIWDFPSVAPYAGRHPCEKPAGLLTHMIEISTRPGDTIIDCFSGSGAVLDAARQLGRKAIGIEMDEKWCRQAVRRLSQQAFDLGELA